MKTVVITGASTGIGRASAEYLSAQGWTVFAGVRKESDGNALTEADSRIVPVIMDVTDADQLRAAAQQVSDRLSGRTLTGLVNNAGIAKMGPLAMQPMDDFEAHFSVNVFGLLRATQAFLPHLGMDTERQGEPGRIVSITSVGGRISAPFLGAYTATKHAVEAMTDTFRRELVIYGIDAIAIGPGAVQTPIWAKAEEANESNPYGNSAWSDAINRFEQVMLDGGREGLPAEDVAKVVETALIDASPKARYAPVPNKLTNFTIPSRLPKRMLDKLMWKRYDLK